MGLWELFLIALGLSMDAFAVSVCKGLATGRCRVRHMLLCGVYFGAFQALMPLLGYLLGSRFEALVSAVAPYIAFALLTFIGLHMIHEGRSGEATETHGDDYSPRIMLPLAVATSIDALAVGVSFAFLNVAVVPSVLLIGVTTFALCAVGLKIGSVFGNRYQAGAECFGGLVLVLIGVKILMDHLLG